MNDFREKLKNHLIVIIYGKVKAGKSSLGNFVAEHAKEKPKFVIWDKSGYTKIVDKFAVDITECTADIQLFELGGLAWVDTPGLSSMSPENGNLARKYIEAADFILFPTSSEYPMTMDEISQISDLLKISKKISVIVTRSDYTDVEEVDNKIVRVLKNKTDEDRKLQCDDVRTRLSDALKHKNLDSRLDTDIFAISVASAEKGFAQEDQKLYEGSNVSRLYKKLTNGVLAKANALKDKSPFSSLCSTIETVISGKNTESGEQLNKSLDSIIDDSQKLVEMIKILEDKISTGFDFQITQAKAIVSDETNNISYKVNIQNSKELFKQAKTEIFSKVNKSIELLLQKEFTDFSKNYSILSDNFEDFEVQNVYRDVTRRRSKKGSGGLFGGILGGVAGFFVGGPAGAAIGSGFGGLLGSGVGSQFRDDSTVQICVGDNSREVLNKFVDKMESEVEDYIKTTKNQIMDELIKPMVDSSSATNNSLHVFRNELLERKKNYWSK